MWLILAIVIVIFSFVFGEHVNLFWLLGIIFSVIYCWNKHSKLKTQVAPIHAYTNSHNTEWARYIDGAVEQMSENFWKLKNCGEYENVLVFHILKDRYAEHLESALIAKVPVNANLNNISRITSIIQWCKEAASMTELCEVFLIVSDFGYMERWSDGAKRFAVRQINTALLKNCIPESLIGDNYKGRLSKGLHQAFED